MMTMTRTTTVTMTMTRGAGIFLEPEISKNDGFGNPVAKREKR